MKGELLILPFQPAWPWTHRRKQLQLIPQPSCFKFFGSTVRLAPFGCVCFTREEHHLLSVRPCSETFHHLPHEIFDLPRIQQWSSEADWILLRLQLQDYKCETTGDREMVHRNQEGWTKFSQNQCSITYSSFRAAVWSQVWQRIFFNHAIVRIHLHC